MFSVIGKIKKEFMWSREQFYRNCNRNDSRERAIWADFDRSLFISFVELLSCYSSYFLLFCHFFYNAMASSLDLQMIRAIIWTFHHSIPSNLEGLHDQNYVLHLNYFPLKHSHFFSVNQLGVWDKIPIKLAHTQASSTFIPLFFNFFMDGPDPKYSTLF